MARQDLIDYIKAQQQKGRTHEEIKNSLLGAGWQAKDVEDAFMAAASGTNVSTPSYGAPAYGNISSTSYLPGAGALLGEAWELYKNRLKTFVGIIAIQVGIMILMISILLILAMIFGGLGGFASAAQSTGFYMSDPPAPPPPSDTSIILSNIMNWLLGFGVLLFIIVIPIIILQFWGQAALLYAIKDSDENIGVIESYKRAWHKLRSFVWVIILTALFIMGGFTLIFIAAYLTSLVAALFISKILSILIFFVGFVAAVIFSITYSIRLAFAQYVVIDEDIKGMNALRKSQEYIKGRGWEIFGLLLVLGLIMFGVLIGIQFVMAIFNAIFSALDLFFLNIIPALLLQAVSISISIIATIYSFLIYKHLRQIKGNPAATPSSGLSIKYLIIGIIVAILLIGLIFGSFFFVSLNSAKDKAMDAARRSEISSIEPALIMYYDDHNDTYPTSLSQLVPKYYYKIPVDPKTKSPYEYRPLKDGKDYELCANFDNGGRKCFNGYNSPSDKNQTLDTTVKKKNQYYAEIGEIKNLWGAGRYQESLDRAVKVLPDAETNEDKAIVHYWIGLSRYKLQDYPNAETQLQLALELDPDYAAPYVTLAAIEMDTRSNFSKALEYAEKCIELDPKYAWCYNSKGLALFQLGQKEEGIKALEQAVALAPDSYVFRDNLTRIKKIK